MAGQGLETHPGAGHYQAGHGDSGAAKFLAPFHPLRSDHRCNDLEAVCKRISAVP